MEPDDPRRDRDPREPIHDEPPVDDPASPIPDDPVDVPPDNPTTGEPERRDPDPREPAWRDPDPKQPPREVCRAIAGMQAFPPGIVPGSTDLSCSLGGLSPSPRG
jgi:hypothetical protein